MFQDLECAKLIIENSPKEQGWDSRTDEQITIHMAPEFQYYVFVQAVSEHFFLAGPNSSK